MSGLEFRERPADGDAQGLLVLHHGRGADEHDLMPLADALDPERRLHMLSPGGPLVLPGWPGRHWYTVPRVGYPDPDTFNAAVAALASFHDEQWARTGIGPERTVLGGFSMGSVMSYALGLGPGRPAPAGLLIFSGFVPTVEGFSPDLARPEMKIFITHGARDPVIAVDFARRARRELETAGLAVDYRETPGGHEIDRAVLPSASELLEKALGSDSRRSSARS